MKKFVVALVMLAACSQQKQPDPGPAPRQATAVTLPGNAPPKQSLMLPIPKDHAQFERLLAMGYTVHEDHLHAPGVTSCPKMSENPVL